MISTELNPFNSPFNFFENRPISHSHQALERAYSFERSEFSSITFEGSQKILNQQVLASLRDKANIPDNSVENLYADDFAPEKVANRILKAIAGFFSELNLRPQDFEEKHEFVDQIKDGIKNGFSQAREILSDLGVLKGDIASNINRTEDLVEKGLARLFLNENAQPSRVEHSNLVNAYRREQSQSLNLQIETKEGDLVHIEIEKMASESRLEIFANSDTEQLRGFSENKFYSEDFSFTVEGDLSESERKEIFNLIRKTGKFVEKFSQGFFDGRLDRAFKHANRLGFNTSHLAGFSLNVESVKAVQVATAYQQFSDAGDSDAGVENVVRAADFVQESQKLLNQSQTVVDEFKQPLDTLNSIILELTQFAAETEQQFQEIAEDSERLLSSVFTDLYDLTLNRGNSTTELLASESV